MHILLFFLYIEYFIQVYAFKNCKITSHLVWCESGPCVRIPHTAVPQLATVVASEQHLVLVRCGCHLSVCLKNLHSNVTLIRNPWRQSDWGGSQKAGAPAPLAWACGAWWGRAGLSQLAARPDWSSPRPPGTGPMTGPDTPRAGIFINVAVFQEKRQNWNLIFLATCNKSGNNLL